MDKLLLCPTDAYSIQGPQTEVLRNELDGGAGRYRADKIGDTSIANVTFSLREEGYQYLYAFFRSKTSRGAEPFLIDLILDGYPRQERTVRFIPGSLSLPEKFKSRFFTITAQLEVDQIEADEGYDASIVDVWEGAGGEDLAGYLNLFNIIVNVNWPHT